MLWYLVSHLSETLEPNHSDLSGLQSPDLHHVDASRSPPQPQPILSLPPGVTGTVSGINQTTLPADHGCAYDSR